MTNMSRENPTLEEVTLLAQLIVDAWEAIPARIDQFCEEFGEQYREPVENMMRTTCGGEELYRESKKFLESL